MSFRLRVILSSACAVMALLACMAYTRRVRDDAERVRAEALERYGGEVTSLVVALDGMEAGDVVSRSNVVVRDWIADLAPDGALLSLDDALGREVSLPVAKGAPLTELNFRDLSDATDVPSGRVALALPITDKLGVARTIAPGTPLAAYAVTNEGTRLIASDMSVLASPSASALGTAAQVSVSVLPSDVTAVLSSSATGDLRLVVPAADVDVASALRDVAPVELDVTDEDGLEIPEGAERPGEDDVA